MIKNIAFKKFIVATLALIFAMLIYYFPSLKDNSVTPIIIENNETVNLYVLNQNNLLTQVNMPISIKEDEIKYKISLLTIDSITAALLPINFKGVIPQEVKLIDYSINNQILILNFSNELLNINNINQVIEALTYSFIDNKDILGITIKVNSNTLKENPNNNETIPNIITKEYGINKKYNITSSKNLTKTTVYYQSIINDEKYYIPITSYTNNNKEKLEIIVDELSKTPIYEDNLISYLTASLELKEYEINEDSINLSFKNNLLYSFSDDTIEEEIIYTLSNSLIDTYKINDIYINFE